MKPTIPYDAGLRTVSTENKKEIRHAATAALIRDGAKGLETLLLQRSHQMKFMGGAWVFPGGGVDAADCPPNHAIDSELTARTTAVRETEEEAGISIRVEDLECIAHWTAPAEAPRRFATWFYLAQMPPGQEVYVDGREIVAHRWLEPQDALDSRERDAMSFLPPTYVTLEWLSAFTDTRSAMEHYKECKPQIFGPKILADGDAIFNIYAEDAAYSTDDVHAPGPRHRFCMSKQQWRYEANFQSKVDS